MWSFYVPTKNGIVNYTDDTPYSSTGTGIHNIIPDLEQASDILPNWFQEIYLKANPDKYHVFFSETSETQLIAKNVANTSSCYEKLLEINPIWNGGWGKHAYPRFHF